MPFALPIEQGTLPGAGLTYVRVQVPLTVLSGTRATPPQRAFVFDIGAWFTTVSEDVAASLGLPPGGAGIGVNSSTATGASGLQVRVRFRFPDESATQG